MTFLFHFSKHLRSGPGLINQPNGVNLYRGLLEYYTTLPGITPEYVYGLGVEEIR